MSTNFCWGGGANPNFPPKLPQKAYFAEKLHENEKKLGRWGTISSVLFPGDTRRERVLRIDKLPNTRTYAALRGIQREQNKMIRDSSEYAPAIAKVRFAR